MSTVISASSARAVSLITIGAVVLVFSPSSIERFVEKIVVPPSLMSTTRSAPAGAVATLARTAVRVIACGIRKVVFAAPVVAWWFHRSPRCQSLPAKPWASSGSFLHPM